MSQHDFDRQKVVLSLYISGLFVALLGIVRLLESALNANWYRYSIEPRTTSGLLGIFTAPLLHADWEHYASNAVALLVLGAVSIYAYRTITYKVVGWIWLLDGLGVWLLGRDSYHLGASGLVYGVASFLMFSGVLRKNRAMLALSFFVIVAYGGLIWGMMPLLEHLSWEAHLFGFLSGIGLAIVYRKEGPQDDPIPEWYTEEESEDDSTNPFIPPQPPPSVDPLFPQAPNIAPREVPRQSEEDDNELKEEQPQIRIRYNYRRNSEN
jgi:membrane associated rhomboid family serine protease